MIAYKTSRQCLQAQISRVGTFWLPLPCTSPTCSPEDTIPIRTLAAQPLEELCLWLGAGDGPCLCQLGDCLGHTCQPGEASSLGKGRKENREILRTARAQELSRWPQEANKLQPSRDL